VAITGPVTLGAFPAAAGGQKPARERILATASALFYGVGIRAAGIDRIIAEAGVAKATFYHHFPTKDALVCAYLREQDEFERRALAQGMSAHADPARLLEVVFETLGEVLCGAYFRGCPFINAAVEYPDAASPVRKVVAEHREWFFGVLRDLLSAAGHPAPGSGAQMLVMLRDGVAVGGQLDRPEAVRATLSSAVSALVRAA
jgi:AcrR family transcriptional regulator